MKRSDVRANRREKRTMSGYDQHDCGGPDVCAGCSSWRHGVYEDGSGDADALIAMRLARVAAQNPDGVRLAAQFLRVPACPLCDFVMRPGHVCRAKTDPSVQ